MIEPLLADDAFLADVEAARAEDGLHVWWLGQSGFLLGSGGRHLLVDPYLSDSLTAKYAGTETPHERLTRRVVAPERLAFVDGVASTHGHTDHLDPETLPAVLADGAVLVCPAGIEELARERSGATPLTLVADETTEVAGFRLTAVPARHPGPQCVGYAIEAAGRTVYHAGDTEPCDPGLRGVDLALLPVNGMLGNLDGTEAAALARLVGARLAVPCHYEMFAFNTASPERFVAECGRLGQPCRLLRAGERLTL